MMPFEEGVPPGGAPEDDPESCLLVRLRAIDDGIERALSEAGHGVSRTREILALAAGHTPRAEVVRFVAAPFLDGETDPSCVREARRLLTLRLLVDAELARCRDSWDPDPTRIRRTYARLATLLRVAVDFEQEFDRTVRSMTGSTRARLLEMRVALMPRPKRLIAAVVVAHGIDRCVAALVAEPGDPGARSAPRALPHDEHGFIAAALGTPGGHGAPHPAARDAAILRAVILSDLERWRALSVRWSPGGTDPHDRDPGVGPASRSAWLEQLRLDVSAYHGIAEGLESDLGRARAEGFDEVARDLTVARGELHDAYRRLTTVVRDAETHGRLRSRELEQLAKPRPWSASVARRRIARASRRGREIARRVLGLPDRPSEDARRAATAPRLVRASLALAAIAAVVAVLMLAVLKRL